jgi:DNA-binding ferritin-like protein
MPTHATESKKAAKTSNPDDFTPEQVKELSDALNPLLADVFVLYIKTKNFHWHMSGPHFRDYHLLLDEQADQIFAISDAIAERFAKSAGRRFAPSDRLLSCSGSRTTTTSLFRHTACWRNCNPIIERW